MLIGFQFAFMMYFSFGGLRSLASIFGRSPEPNFDYTRTHDVYTNLTRLQSTYHPRTQIGGLLPWCPEKSPYLLGPITVTFSRVPSFRRIQEKNPLVRTGGRYQPPNCESRHKTAVIIPHRNRGRHTFGTCSTTYTRSCSASSCNMESTSYISRGTPHSIGLSS
ncbi:unnamed protein product [Ranitomeya imitator]|uniref:Galactosyltransferase N-terminal domain-containing protein n=1 Tax=Ranitomeya imitator TaxID=111125 RepID=A0ABN9LBQ2_9NEOB|nr:unnamed protein product [Ranitomeya imitator]